MEENFNDYFDFSDDQTEHLVDKYERFLSRHASHFFDVDDFLDIISYYSENSKYDKALKAIEMALRQHPASSEILLLKANVFFQQRYYEKAFQQLKEIELLEASNPEFHLLKGNIYVQMNNIHQALKSYYTCLSIAEEDRYDFVEYIASYLVTTKNYKEALPFLEAAFEKDRLQSSLLYDIAIVYEELGAYDKLEKLLKEALEEDPFDAIFWAKLGDLYLQKEKTQNALEAYQCAVSVNDSAIESFEKIATLYFNEKKYKDAIRYYEYLFEKDKLNVDYLISLAYSYYHIGETEVAVRYFKKCLLLDSENPKIYVALASIEAELNKIEDAIRHLDLAILYDSKNSSYLLQKANLLVKLGFDGQAVDLFESSCYEQKYDMNICHVYVDFLIETIFNAQIALIVKNMSINENVFHKHVHDFFEEFLDVNYKSQIPKHPINIYNLMTNLIMSFSLS
jgi:tetratricopeptide (TPR) repeat protein